MSDEHDDNWNGEDVEEPTDLFDDREEENYVPWWDEGSDRR